jgi:hypothetical protein
MVAVEGSDIFLVGVIEHHGIHGSLIAGLLAV